MQTKRANRRSTNRSAEAGAFTLIELLTVVFIIGLLIAILVPAINLARNAAKNAKTASLLKAVDTGLQMFKQENEKDFRVTNGYPPSFVHPKIKGLAGFTETQRNQGRFPFVVGGTFPQVSGAHWLPFFLVGKDALGYIKLSTVPDSIRDEPDTWYTEDPLGSNKGILERASLYVDPETLRLKKTAELPGLQLTPGSQGGTESPLYELPVIVDPFDQAVLYYAANTHGTGRNMVSPEHKDQNDYAAEGGPPYYFHQDNAFFTGDDADPLGWDYGNRAREIGGDMVLHRIARSGHDVVATDLMEDANRETFARYVVDLNAFRRAPGSLTDSYPLKPVRADSYLLITAGVDGLYGTNDDVTTLPAFED